MPCCLVLGGCHPLLPPVSRRHWPPAASGRGAAAPSHRRVCRKAARRSMRHRGVDWTLRELAVTSNMEANRPFRESLQLGGSEQLISVWQDSPRGPRRGARREGDPRSRGAARLPGWPAAVAPNNKTTTRKQMTCVSFGQY